MFCFVFLFAINKSSFLPVLNHIELITFLYLQGVIFDIPVENVRSFLEEFNELKDSKNETLERLAELPPILEKSSFDMNRPSYGNSNRGGSSWGRGGGRDRGYGGDRGDRSFGGHGRGYGGRDMGGYEDRRPGGKYGGNRGSWGSSGGGRGAWGEQRNNNRGGQREKFEFSDDEF